MRRIFRPKRDVVNEEYRKLLNEELNDLYYSPNIFRVTKLRRMRWVEYVARRGGTGVYTGFWLRNLGERDNLEDPCLDGRIILK